MQLRLAPYHIVYAITTEHTLMKSLSPPILPNTYILVYVNHQGNDTSGVVSVVGSKNPYKIYTFTKSDLLGVSSCCITYEIFSN